MVTIDTYEEYGKEQRIELLLNCMKGVMEKFNISADEAMEAMNISDADRELLETKI